MLPNLHTLPKTTSADLLTQADLAAEVSCLNLENKAKETCHNNEITTRAKWRRADAVLKLSILNTIPKDIYKSVVYLTTP